MRWKNAHLAWMHGRAGCAAADQPQPNSAFSALHQAPKARLAAFGIENRLERPKPDTLLGLCILVSVIFGVPLPSQELGLEAAQALDEWRWGVVAYNDGLPGKSLLAMERALTLNPEDTRILEWLGRAYRRSGMENAALDIWDGLDRNGNADTALKRRIEQLRRRIRGDEEIPVDDDWIPLAAFAGVEDDTLYFRRPSAARSLGDGSGSLLIASYAGGEVVLLDANGALTDRFDGGIEGLDRPFDVLPLGDGRMLVSEFQADRVSVLSLEGYNRGYRIDTWGETGRGPRGFLGPQYMTLSPDGNYVYISDWGNRRVSKWRLDGTPVLHLSAGAGFSGFLGPAGVAALEGRVYVADARAARIEVFDPSGNYLGSLIEEGLNRPEGLAVDGDALLVSDGERIHRIDLKSGELTLEVSLGAGDHRITSVFPDDNGNLAVSNFDSDQVILLTPLSTLYGGLDVTLDRVRGDAYPEIVVDLTVRDRSGVPISGLDESNFRAYDGETSIDRPSVDWRSSDDRTVSVAAVVDSPANADRVRALFGGIDEMMNAMTDGDTLALTAAEADPVLFELAQGDGPEAFYTELLRGSGESGREWDEALRLAATQLVPRRNRKAVAALVSEAPGESAFDQYGLVETARLMANNGIVFYPVYADEAAVSRELNYIASQTGGRAAFLFDPEGSGRIIEELRNSNIGRYTLTWRTSRSSGFGRDFLPVAVEVIYIKKSGRDESGTFAPLG